MNKQKALVSAVLIFTISFSSISFATNVSSQQNKLNTVKTEKNKVTQELNAKKKEVNNINQNIYSLDKKINESQSKLDDLQSQLSGLNVNIKETKEKITQIEKDLDKNEKLLEERLRVMYKTSGVTYIQILLESENFSDLLSNLNNIQRIVTHDKDLLKSLEDSKKKHEQQKKSLEDSKNKITSIQAQMSSEKQVMESNMNTQLQEKNKISSDIEKLKLQEAELQKESASIEKQIQAALSSSSSKSSTQKTYTGGTMAWPLAVKGTITSRYGSRKDPFTKQTVFHQGVDIAAPKGTAVYAGADGVVISSGYQNSYGNVVMIDHGGGIVTVYAHNSSLVAKKGATVKKGQLIAKVGSTGYSTGNHLHFEVRKNGKPISPNSYIGI